MKKTLQASVWLFLTLLVLTTACRTNQVVRVYQPAGKPMPPGHAKKVYGHQSAKAFAPGQQKKQGVHGYSKGKVVGPGQPANPGKGGKGKKKKK